MMTPDWKVKVNYCLFLELKVNLPGSHFVDDESTVTNVNEWFDPQTKEFSFKDVRTVLLC
jgi:hypothetical protein